MITSIQNDKVKYWKKLHKRKDRSATGTFLIEGHHLLEEAQKSGWDIVEIIVKEGMTLLPWYNNFSVINVSKQVFNHITKTETPQGIAAVVKMKKYATMTGNHLLLIDAIQDPGNLGTIIRTADAAGFDAILLGNGTVDLYNDKVIRSTQGSLFHIPIYTVDLATKIPSLKKDGFSIWASALTNAKPFHTMEKTNEKVALIVGNEGAGIRENITELADHNVIIPIYGQAESLNVSVAAGILMYYLKQ